jgi:hypothetical protein
MSDDDYVHMMCEHKLTDTDNDFSCIVWTLPFSDKDRKLKYQGLSTTLLLQKDVLVVRFV